MLQSLILLAGILVYSVRGQSNPMACFDNNIDVISLHNCLAAYFATPNSLGLAEWDSMLPVMDEISQYKQLVKAAMDATDPSFCSSATLNSYPAINDDITMRRFMNYYCVIVEKNLRYGKSPAMFNRGWGYVIIADKSWTLRNLHHSAPHPVSELYTPTMSSSIFYITRSRSLINAGASRDAVDGARSPCIADDPVADAAHENRTMFHALSAAIYEHENSNCSHANCAFIQWHSFANNSCNDTKIFITTGVDNSAGLYNNNALPAIKIANAFNQLGSVGATAMTAKDSTCNLLASDNIQGRLYNGVAAGDVCTGNPASSQNTVTGNFVNINLEQWLEDVSRWSHTISMAFPNSGSVVVPKVSAVIFAALVVLKLSYF
uniref:Uncharacterized protein n=1 Tax=Plectus sambesii TaxID=2011161 RepID=A0A914XSS0_9BILA